MTHSPPELSELTYTYESLPSASSIRVINLLPAPSASAPLIATITTLDLDDPNHAAYQALSYEWTPPNLSTDPKWILSISNSSPAVATAQVPIRENLRDALVSLRPARSDAPPLSIWADAICIHQSDNLEKTAQVARMYQVFAQADRVVAWLGAWDPAPAAEAMRAACNLHRFYCSGSGLVSWKSAAERQPGALCCDGIRSDELPETSEMPPLSDLTAATILFHRTYFTRTWMAQELGAAKRGVLRCGWVEIDLWCIWDMAIGLLSTTDQPQLHEPLEAFSDLVQHAPTILVSLSLAGTDGTFQRLKLVDLLDVIRQLRCWDPRDKVFAILSVAPPGSCSLIADYSLSVEEVYTQTARELITQGDDLADRLLREPSVDRDSRLPSWVPDWRETGLHSGLNGISTEMDFSGVGPTPCCEPFVSFPAPGLLQLRGVRVSTVHSISLASVTADSEDLTLDLSEQLQLARSTADETGCYPHWHGDGHHSVEGQFLRAIMANTWLYAEFPRNRMDIMHDQKLRQACIGLKAGQARFEDPPIVRDLQVRFLSHGFFTTGDQMMGLCPNTSRPGDCILLVVGCRVPVVARPLENGHFRMVGAGHLQGYQNGEWVRKLAMRAKKEDKEAEGVPFDSYLEEFKKEESILAWTQELVFE